MPELTGTSVKAWISPILAIPVVLGAALGPLGGWLWWTWWGPAPDGKIYDTRVGAKWYPDPFDPGVARDFGGTATFVVVGVGLALLLGVVTAVLCRRTAVAGLVAVVVGASIGAALMVLVGTSFSPPDPATLVASHKVGDALPGHLHVAGWSPYLIWPVGALLGYFVVMVSILSPSQARAAVSSETTESARPPSPAAT